MSENLAYVEEGSPGDEEITSSHSSSDDYEQSDMQIDDTKPFAGKLNNNTCVYAYLTKLFLIVAY